MWTGRRYVGWIRYRDGHWRAVVKGTDYASVLQRLITYADGDPISLVRRLPCQSRVVLRAGERPESGTTIKEGEMLDDRLIDPREEWEYVILYDQ